MEYLWRAQRVANKLTLGTVGTTITIESHTASKMLALNASKNLEVVTIGTSLNYARPTLNTIQDIRTTADPTFAALTVTTINGLGVKYTATGNIAIGDTTTLDALDTDPTHNIAIGNGAGSSLTDGDSNIYIGYRAGYEKTTSVHSIAIGHEAFYKSNGAYAIAIGTEAMRYHATGNGNTVIGYQAGMGTITGSSYTYNTVIGDGAGRSLTTGSTNVIIGRYTGTDLTTGGSNIFIGQAAGHTQTDNSNLLIIDNQERANVATDITNAIIYGVMAATPADQTLRINAGLQLRTLTITESSDILDVSGVNTVLINITSDIILGGLVGGVDGQTVNFAIIGNFTNHCRFEHQEGIGGNTQDFINHLSVDEDIDHGGCIYVCNGTNWYDISHSRHV